MSYGNKEGGNEILCPEKWLKWEILHCCYIKVGVSVFLQANFDLRRQRHVVRESEKDK